MYLRMLSGIGLLVFVGLAWLISENRRKVDWRLVGWGLVLQLAVGVVVLKTPLRQALFRWMSGLIGVLNDSTAAGASLLFGGLNERFVINSGALVKHEGDLVVDASLAFHALPVIIFVSAVTAILYHLHVVQAAVRVVAWTMRRTLKTSGAETLGAALLIFLGIESMTAIRVYLKDMTRSELCTLMTAFMATIAGSVMVIYAGQFGAEPGHLLAASLMSAPAAILMAKIMVPETEEPATRGHVRVNVPVTTHNVVDAAAHGTSEGLRLALNVGAMLITFIGLIYLCNLLLGALFPFTLVDIMRWVFMPFAWLLGVPREDVGAVSEMLGTKTVFNEFLAYMRLKDLVTEGTLNPRSVTIATYALCGFANPGSLGILIAGLTGLAPERRKDIVQLGLRCFVGGTLACFMTAAVAGILVTA